MYASTFRCTDGTYTKGCVVAVLFLNLVDDGFIWALAYQSEFR